MKRIICVGNRYVQEDAAGPAVYDCLMSRPVPADIEVIDGGLAGIDLLHFLEGTTRVVFVDRVCGFGSPHDPVVLTEGEVVSASDCGYGHSAGLTYLLRVLPAVCKGAPPEISLVGVDGAPRPDVIEKAASLALNIASGVYCKAGAQPLFGGGAQWH